jgi:hypothetical protein
MQAEEAPERDRKRTRVATPERQEHKKERRKRARELKKGKKTLTARLAGLNVFSPSGDLHSETLLEGQAAPLH